MKTLLIEIGSEEIPARFILRGLDLLKEALLEFFKKSMIDHGDVSFYATPRRLTLSVGNVAEKQRDRVGQKTGPPKKAGIDDKGNYTKAATGFFRSLGIDTDPEKLKKNPNLKIIHTERGEYVAAVIEEKGRATKDVLAESLPGIITSLQLPKSMRWGGGSLRYFRPVRWILALLGKDTVPFELDGIKSGDITYGHRFLSSGEIKVADPVEYTGLLEKNYVIADINKRRQLISGALKKAESEINAAVHEDEELLDIVTNLVEYPVAVTGHFDNKFLALPGELLITVMKSHQKYFSMQDDEGNIRPHFVVISNTGAENNDTVRKGAERVLRARLDDAMFYFNEDLNTALIDHAKELKKVTFQEKLGSMHEKANRIASLSSFIADRLNIVSKERLLRAGMLCKADLVTGVVGEFPELQGYMGMIYALNSGEDPETASAIHEHYFPRFAGDRLPSGEAGAIISIADKMDNIAAFFSLGLIPTGSEDPFALRRQATGILHILRNSGYVIPLRDLIEKSMETMQPDPDRREELLDAVLKFFYQRLEHMFSAQGYEHDLVNAVLASGESDIKDLESRIDILTEMKTRTGFPVLLTAAKRVYNILSDAQPAPFSETLMAEAAERELYNAVKEVNDKLSTNDFNALFDLEKPVNKFFENVLVMDPDEKTRNNRLALLSLIKISFDSLADFSEIVD